MEKSNNNVPALCNQSSSETPAKQKINAPDNSKGNNANFPNPHMSVNNVYNFDAHLWSKNTILIAGTSMIDGINKKRISTNFKSIKVRSFSGGTIDDMFFELTPLLRKKPAALDLNVDTNNLSNETSFQIDDKLLNFVHFVKENNANCHVVLSSQSIDLMMERQISLLRGDTVYYQNPHFTSMITAILDMVFLVCTDCI